ncbi:hypothetical protein TorRG33x02_332060, partial [Trema orientale]
MNAISMNTRASTVKYQDITWQPIIFHLSSDVLMMRALTIRTWPYLAATCKGVSPFALVCSNRGGHMLRISLTKILSVVEALAWTWRIVLLSGVNNWSRCSSLIFSMKTWISPFSAAQYTEA